MPGPRGTFIDHFILSINELTTKHSIWLLVILIRFCLGMLPNLIFRFEIVTWRIFWSCIWYFISNAVSSLLLPYTQSRCSFFSNLIIIIICDALLDLVPFVQFTKPEKHSWRSVNFGTKSNTPPRVFFTFCKLYKWCQIAQNITII